MNVFYHNFSPFFQPIIYYKISKMRQKSFEVLDNVFGHFSNEILFLKP
jgi:hypothetical protein